MLHLICRLRYWITWGDQKLSSLEHTWIGKLLNYVALLVILGFVAFCLLSAFHAH